jgi:hypothetical protein
MMKALASSYFVKDTIVKGRAVRTVHIEGEVGVPFTQKELFSIVQLEEQPSPLFVLPSSH